MDYFFMHERADCELLYACAAADSRKPYASGREICGDRCCGFAGAPQHIVALTKQHPSDYMAFSCSHAALQLAGVARLQQLSTPPTAAASLRMCTCNSTLQGVGVPTKARCTSAVGSIHQNIHQNQYLFIFRNRKLCAVTVSLGGEGVKKRT